MGRLDSHRGDYSGRPRWASWLLSRFSPPGLEDELQGDLLEMYDYWVKTVGVRAARWRYGLAVLQFIRPFMGLINNQSDNYSQPSAQRPQSQWANHRTTSILQPAMIRNYLQIAWRTMARNKVYSAINMGGLALGLAVAIFTGLWVRDELTFDQSFAHYDRLGQVIMYQTFSGQREPQDGLPLGLADALRTSYPDLKEVTTSSWNEERILAYGNQKITRQGNAVEPQFTRMFSLKMLQGVQDGLQNIHSIMLSASTATALFGQANPIGKLVRMDGKTGLTDVESMVSPFSPNLPSCP